MLWNKKGFKDQEEARRLMLKFIDGGFERELEKSFVSILENKGWEKNKDFDVRIDLDEDQLMREFKWGAAKKYGLTQFAGTTLLVKDKRWFDEAVRAVCRAHTREGAILNEVSNGWMQFDGRFLTVRCSLVGARPLPVGITVRDATMDWANQLEYKYVVANEKIPKDVKSQVRRGILHFVSGYCRSMEGPVGIKMDVPRKLDTLARGFVKPFEKELERNIIIPSR